MKILIYVFQTNLEKYFQKCDSLLKILYFKFFLKFIKLALHFLSLTLIIFFNN